MRLKIGDIRIDDICRCFECSKNCVVQILEKSELLKGGWYYIILLEWDTKPDVKVHCIPLEKNLKKINMMDWLEL